MNVLSAIESDMELAPETALLVYRGGNLSCVTVHEVLKQGDLAEPPKYVLGAGRLITRQALTDLSAELNGGPRARSFLPASMLCYEGGRMMWWVPSKKRPIYFNTADKKFNTEVGTHIVLHPALVFVAGSDGMWVYALAESVRPEPETKLYRAPYLNISSDGKMCAGSVMLPKEPGPENRADYEEAFFGTNFAHSNLHGKEKLTKHIYGHAGLWKDMLKGGEFPAASLVDIDLTVRRIINSK